MTYYYDENWNPVEPDFDKGTGESKRIELEAAYEVTQAEVTHDEPITYYLTLPDGTKQEVDASTVDEVPEYTTGTDIRTVVDVEQQGNWQFKRDGKLWGDCPDVHQEWMSTGDVYTIPFEYTLWHWYTAEELAQRAEEKAEREAEQEEAEAKAELMDALPDAVADLSEQVSTNSIDAETLMEAVADLSQIVSDLMSDSSGSEE